MSSIYLAPIEEDNLELFRVWRNTPSIMNWCRQHKPISEHDQIDWYHRIHDDPTIEMFEIKTSGGKTVGVCGLTSIDFIHRRAEFSLYIAPEYQRTGWGSEALNKLCFFGFESLGLKRIWGESFSGNPAMKMFEQIGFEKEGIRKEFYFKNGRFIDCHLYSISSGKFIN